MFVWVSLPLRAVKHCYDSFQNNSTHTVSWPLFHISTVHLRQSDCLELAKLWHGRGRHSFALLDTFWTATHGQCPNKGIIISNPLSCHLFSWTACYGENEVYIQNYIPFLYLMSNWGSQAPIFFFPIVDLGIPTGLIRSNLQWVWPSGEASAIGTQVSHLFLIVLRTSLRGSPCTLNHAPCNLTWRCIRNTQ